MEELLRRALWPQLEMFRSVFLFKCVMTTAQHVQRDVTESSHI